MKFLELKTGPECRYQGNNLKKVEKQMSNGLGYGPYNAEVLGEERILAVRPDAEVDVVS